MCCRDISFRSDLLAVEVNKEADKQKAAKGGPKTTGEENEEQQQQEEEAEEQHKKVLRVDAMLRCTDVIRVRPSRHCRACHVILLQET